LQILELAAPFEKVSWRQHAGFFDLSLRFRDEAPEVPTTDVCFDCEPPLNAVTANLGWAFLDGQGGELSKRNQCSSRGGDRDLPNCVDARTRVLTVPDL